MDLAETIGECGLDEFYSGYKQVVGCSEHITETSGSTEHQEIE